MKYNNLRTSQTGWLNQMQNSVSLKTSMIRWSLIHINAWQSPKPLPSWLIHRGGGSGLAKRRLRGGNRFEDHAMAFYEKDKHVIPIHHNKPSYMTAHACSVELRRAMVDVGSSLKIMPLCTLEAMGIPRDRIIKQFTEVSGFGGSASIVVGFIKLDLTIGPVQVANRCHDYRCPTSYCFLLGRLDPKTQDCPLHLSLVPESNM